MQRIRVIQSLKILGVTAALCGGLGYAALQSAWAQDLNAQHRLERLEREMTLMQRQLYQGSGHGGPTGTTIAPSANAADIEVRLTQMEEKMRRLTGQIEQVQYGIDQLNKSLEKKEKDLAFRLNALEQGSAVAPTATMSTPPVASAPATTSAVPATPPPPVASAVPMQPPLPEGQASALPERSGDNPRNLATPAPGATAEYPYGVDSREHYNQAFQLLNQARFDEARTALQSFIDRFPKDALVGNAYYWLGETFYVERDYLSAADTFRQGFEKSPKGPKAPDNLLKLGMSMAAMGKSSDACVVYSQLSERYDGAGASINQKIKQEKSRLDCP